MTPSRSRKSGVTFIEIMLTVFMMGMILSTAFISQSTVLGQIGKWSRSLRSTLALRELFIHVSQDRLVGKAHPKEDKRGNTVLTYIVERPKKESSLAKMENLYIQRATTARNEAKETMISLLYKPEKPEDKK